MTLQDIYSLFYTACAFCISHAVPIIGFIALCLQVIWLIQKIRRERYEYTKLKQEDTKEDTAEDK